MSFHGLGALIFSAKVKAGESICTKLSFSNPTECIHITGNIVSLFERTQNNILVSSVGLSTTNSSAAYMGRIALYATKMEMERKAL